MVSVRVLTEIKRPLCVRVCVCVREIRRDDKVK